MLLVALIAGASILVILIITTLVEVGVGDEKNEKGVADILFERLPEHINLVVVLIVVAIPEGLPLTVGLSLAFSVRKMFADGILVRKLDAPERLASCEEILCGKTATITANEMTVAHFYLEGNQFKNARKDTFFHCELTEETIELVKDSILYNCTATVEMGETTFAPSGNGTEVGLLNFL